jgi:hypothetical protein
MGQLPFGEQWVRIQAALGQDRTALKLEIKDLEFGEHSLEGESDSLTDKQCATGWGAIYVLLLVVLVVLVRDVSKQNSCQPK